MYTAVALMRNINTCQNEVIVSNPVNSLVFSRLPRQYLRGSTVFLVGPFCYIQ